MVTSKYDWWLGEQQRKKQLDINIKDHWPRKTRLNDFNLEKAGAKQPKFMRWEKKLLDQLLSKTKKRVM